MEPRKGVVGGVRWVILTRSRWILGFDDMTKAARLTWLCHHRHYLGEVFSLSSFQSEPFKYKAYVFLIISPLAIPGLTS